MRCDLPLPEDVFLVNEVDPEIAGQSREYVRTILDERRLLLLGEQVKAGPNSGSAPPHAPDRGRTAHQVFETDRGLDPHELRRRAEAHGSSRRFRRGAG